MSAGTSRRAIEQGTFWLVALSACLLGQRTLAADSCQPLVEYDTITQVVTDRFYDKTFRGLDWPARVAAVRADVTCADDANRVAAKINRLLAELHASHTGTYTRDDPDYWALQSIFSRSLDKYPVAFSGIWPELRDGTWRAKYVLPTSPAFEAGVLAGDEIVSVDGKPFRPLGVNADAPSTVVLSSDGRSQHTVRMQARRQGMQQFFFDATRDSTRILPIGEHRAGYFHLWAGTNERFLNAINDAMATFEKEGVDALILDLRGGFGGAGLEYLEAIRASRRLSAIPKFVLIDDGVRSGKEWLAATVKAEKLGTLVGSRTAGMFLAGEPNRFFDDTYLLYLAVAKFEPPGIGPIEGIGVSPDVAVEPCRVNCRGADPQLDKAMELIRALPPPGASREAG